MAIDRLFLIQLANFNSDLRRYAGFTVKDTILVYALECDREISPAEICKHILIKKSNLTVAAGELLEDCLLEKAKNENDKREISYKITEKGRKYLEEKEKKIKESFKLCFGERASEFGTFLDKIYK
ncbi:MAG: hypothetical protein FWD89_04230 [Firmicutes bacterium]|nr:hypothetical protein [Bacillota bacterium]